jgi:hypothetical protein
MSDPLPNDPLCQRLAEVIQRLDTDPAICVFRDPTFPGGFNINTLNDLVHKVGLVTLPATLFQVILDEAEKRTLLRLCRPDGWPPLDLSIHDPTLGKDRAWREKAVAMKYILEEWLARRQEQLAPPVQPAVQHVADTDPSPRKKGRKKTGRRRGRPAKTDEAADARIAAAWQSGQYKDYEDLARELKILNRNNRPDGREVEKALDRDRKRHPPASE